MPEDIAVIGAGAWGTTQAILLGNQGHRVRLYVREPELAESMAATRENHVFLPGVRVPDTVQVTNSLPETVAGAALVAIVVPSHGFRTIVRQLRDRISPQAVVVSLTKGLETDTLQRMSEVLTEELPPGLSERTAVMSGPNLAGEVSLGMPTATVAAAQDRRVAEYIQETFMTPNFRVYTHHDVIGVELGGSLKNVIALSAGISDGLGFGDNTRASLMTRGLAEIARLGHEMGAELLTFAGLSGLGDLVCTCTSARSRNHQAGIRLGRGESLDQILGGTGMVIEGVRTAEAAYRLALRYGMELPITEETYRVLYAGKTPRAAVASLMGRERKFELEEAAMYRRRDEPR